MKYQITNEMMDTEIRKQGKIMRFWMPKTTLAYVKMENIFTKMFSSSKWQGKNSVAREVYIERENGTKMRVLIIQSKEKTKDGATGLLWIHGGGYMMGNPEMDVTFNELFLENQDTIIVSPDYTLATKAPYPAALDDCYLALKWLKDNAEELGVNRNQIFVGGESAGGGLCAATCIKARDEGEINVAFQMPLYPMISDLDTETNINNDAPVWNTASNKLGWKMYLGDLEDIPATASPSRLENYENLPPLITYVGDIEPFQKEVEDYVENCRKANVETYFKIYHGAYHAFDTCVKDAKISKDALNFLRETYHMAQTKYFKENYDARKL